MPNWCYTSMTIEGNDAKNLYDNIVKWQNEGTEIENSWGNEWLGLLVEKGLNTDPVNGKYECRGCFTLDSFDNDMFQVYTETAWGPMMAMWSDLIETYCPTSELLYSAEEPGCGVYVTNDPDLEGKYCLDSWDDEIESIWDATEDDIREAMSKATGEDTSNMGIRELVCLYDDEVPDFSFNAWEYCAV